MPWACCLAFASVGSSNDARMAMIAITTSNSIKVNAALTGLPPRLQQLRQGWRRSPSGSAKPEAAPNVFAFIIFPPTLLAIFYPWTSD